MIELLIVVALIMILSSVGLGAYTISTTKSYDTQRKSDLNQIVKAIESFGNDVGRYPLSDSEGRILCYEKNGTTVTDSVCIGSKLMVKINGVSTSYITVPADPDPSQKYVYESDGTTFNLYANIHNIGDKDLIKDESGIPLTDPFGVSCGLDKCNYKITETGLAKTNE